MDLSPLLAAIAALRSEGSESTQEIQSTEPGELSDLDRIVDALKGKGKGKGKGPGRIQEDRKCYKCGKVGHLARDCRAGRQPKGKGKDGESKGGKGKGRSTHSVECEASSWEDNGGISVGNLIRAPAAELLNTYATSPEVWRGYECVEALIDSGASECVCGP